MEPTEQAELDAQRDLYAAGGALHEIGKVVCTAVPELPSSSMLNRALGVGLGAPATEQQLGEIVAFYDELGTVCSIPVAPGARPAALTSWLEARSFRPGYAWMKLRRRVGPPGPVETDLRVEEIGPDRGGDFAHVVAEGYGLPESESPARWFAAVPGRPGWHCYLALAGKEPAAAAALHARDGLGWLGLAATLPEFRRRGAQNALFAARFARAAELGLDLLVTETGERLPDRPSNSYRNILRNGFEEAYLRPNWVRAA